MRLRPLGLWPTGATIALCLAFASSPAADASPRFSVGNKSDDQLKILIYNGDDGDCNIPLKTKAASSKETDSYGCQGNGKGRCKIEIYKGGYKICKSLHNTCSDGAIIMKDDSLVYIYSTPVGYDCVIQD